MGRIRTIKPEFFRHEALQDLEILNPGLHPMLVFAGLWTAADGLGRFEWKPRMLKLDILPFLPFEMADTLNSLEAAGMIQKYEVDGKLYGKILSFSRHQRITGKESESEGKYPEPPQNSAGETSGKHRGNTCEAPGDAPDAQERKGKERKGKGEGGADRDDSAQAAAAALDPPAPAAASPPLTAAIVCAALKAAGIRDANNPLDAELQQLLAENVALPAFDWAAKNAVLNEKPRFAYVIATVKNQRHGGTKNPVGANLGPPRLTIASNAAAATQAALNAESARCFTAPTAEHLAALAAVRQAVGSSRSGAA